MWHSINLDGLSLRNMKYINSNIGWKLSNLLRVLDWPTSTLDKYYTTPIYEWLKI